TRSVYESSRTDFNLAKVAVRENTKKVVSAATDLLVAEAFQQANALEAAWDNIWRLYDRLSALAACELRFAENSHRIKLPPEIVKLMEAIAAVDRRSFPDEHNDAAARAADIWCRWFEALLVNAEAEAIFESKNSDGH